MKNENESTIRRCEALNSQLQQSIQDLQNKQEEKDLLHSRHDALTNESQGLQKDLNKARAHISDLETSLQEEKQYAEENDRQLRSDEKARVDELSEQISALQRQIHDQQGKSTAERDQWESQRRDLQSQKARVDEQLSGLQRTVDTLHEAEGTLSSKEMRLQEALESEKDRHQSEEVILEERIQELKDDIEDKRQELEELRSELSQTKEDLRVSEHEMADCEARMHELDDEIEILQDERDGEVAMKAREGLESAEEEANDLRAQLIEAQQQLDDVASPEARKTSSEFTHVQDQLQDASQQLQTTKRERQNLQDQLATNSLELHRANSLLVETEAERDALRIQVDEMRNQVDDTFKFDQERLDLRKSKIRLEGEVERLRVERKALVEKQAALEGELESEVARAFAQEDRLKTDIELLQHKLSTKADGQHRGQKAAEQRAEHLQSRVLELEDLVASTKQREDAAQEVSQLQKDVSAARNKESEYLQREKAQKEVLRDLKTKVSHLEKQSHEAEMARLVADSPKSSAAGSARKNEVAELRLRATDLDHQLRDTKAKSKDELRTLQRRLLDTERDARISSDASEQQREQLESDLATSRQEQGSLKTQNASATQTITRLRTRISSLEHDLQLSRRGHQTAATDTTIAEERADLHDMLKDAKLAAEDLQLQIDARDSSLRAANAKEKDLRTQLRRVRDERGSTAQKANALTTELESLHGKYDRVITKLSAEQKRWDEERRAIVSKVRFTNVDTSSLHDPRRGQQEMGGEGDGEATRHRAELKALGMQIQYLRSRCRRSEGFRDALAHEKRYLGLQVKMFEACNRADLELLGEIGVTPPGSTRGSEHMVAHGEKVDARARLKLGDSIRSQLARAHGEAGKKRPSLKAVVGMVVAVQRMRKGAESWRRERRVGEEVKRMVRAQRMSLGTGVEGWKGESGKNRGKRRRSVSYR